MWPCLFHTCLFVRGLQSSGQRSVKHGHLSQWPHLFLSGGTRRSLALRQLMLGSAPVLQGRTGILPGGGLGSWLLTTPVGFQPAALPKEDSKLKESSRPCEWQVKTYRTVQSKALPRSVLSCCCTLGHMLLGDKGDTRLFSSAGLWNHLGRIFLIENQNTPWCLTNLQSEKSASAHAAGRQEEGPIPWKKIFFKISLKWYLCAFAKLPLSESKSQAVCIWEHMLCR